ncbi:copper-binding protein [Streptomyces spongiae]|uniref:Copper-binding protein n=1 Tax=Streptomyces spongiae TaxID=565072 RepID=A0A5N8XYR4_9ACTN|nr:copper-binding protein [Streptomyces spongiae]
MGAVLVVLALPTLLFAAPERAAAASYRVVMKGYAFAPGTLTVDVGSTVTWTNQDTAPHDVKTTSGPASFHSPMLDKGQSWSFTFTEAGSYGYYCTVHPDMTAGIVVRAAAPATPAAPATHDHSGSSSGQHRATVPGRAATAVTPSTRAPAARTTHTARSPSASPSMSMASPAAVDSPPTTTAPQAQQTVSAARPLDPLLVLAGLVAGVAVLCLLLVGSRAAASREGGGGD